MKHILLLLCCCVNIVFAQQTEYVDFKTAKASISLSSEVKQVEGSITYTFEILKDVDSIYLDAQNFKHIEGLLDKKIYHNYNGKQLVIKKAFKTGEQHQVVVSFITQPKKALYFIDWEHQNGNKQIWTQGQGKYTSNWLPSIDDMNEKIEFDLSITFDKNYQVIANGKLKNKHINDSTITWQYDMKHPMPSYLVALAIGKYHKNVEYSKSGVPLEMYYYPEDTLKFEPTYRYTKQLFDVLEKEIGVPYPWQNYKMVPVKDFLYAGMENTSLNIFSDSFVVDSIAFIDKNFVNINAHELAHQWFGDLVTATSGTHHWLQEGFATYYALLAEKEIFGDDYYYWQLYEYAQELKAQDEAGQSTSLLNPKSSSTTFYKKGCWVLHMLREQVGDKAFKKAVKNYVLKHQFKNVNTDDFILEIKNISDYDLAYFVNHFIESKDFDYADYMPYLWRYDSCYSSFFEVDCENNAKHCLKLFKSTKNRHMKSELIKSLGNKIPEKFFTINDLKLRQSIVLSGETIEPKSKIIFEEYLKDRSYRTQEIALFNLWVNFPAYRFKYLNQTKGIIGFNDKNVRTLWLTLALVTEDFQPEHKSQYFQELTAYTSPKYGFEVRQNAFQYLHQIKACNDECKSNLKQATTHHNWRFKQFSKSLLAQK